MKPKKAFILAGGLGTRLRPLTLSIPKQMLPIQNRPILEHVIDLFKRHGVNDIILSIGYMAEKYQDYFGNGKRFGINIGYTVEHQPLGTAGPLHLARKHFNETFYMCNGDELKDINLDEMYEFHKKEGALATIALVRIDDVSQYGVAEIDGNRIKRFVEKPKKEDAPSNLISSGLYIVEPEIINYIPEGRAVSIEREVWPVLASRGDLAWFPYEGQWFPTDNLERYEKAEKEWKTII